jgi:hypothetical protein
VTIDVGRISVIRSVTTDTFGFVRAGWKSSVTMIRLQPMR